MTEKIKNKHIMTREKLNKLLSFYAGEAYWHGEDTGNYGEQDPGTHKEVESELWEQLNNYRIKSEQFKGQIRLRLDQFRKIKELIKGWEVTREFCGQYAEGYADALKICLKLLQSGKYLETD